MINLDTIRKEAHLYGSCAAGDTILDLCNEVERLRTALENVKASHSQREAAMIADIALQQQHTTKGTHHEHRIS